MSNHKPLPDDRLDRMMADPAAYFAEARARARELVERDLARDRRRQRVSRQQMRDRVWLALLVLASAAGGWFGHAPSPVSLFAACAVAVLGGTWYVAGRDDAR